MNLTLWKGPYVVVNIAIGESIDAYLQSNLILHYTNNVYYALPFAPKIDLSMATTYWLQILRKRNVVTNRLH